MRICLVVHGFPPVERTGVEQYTQGLCRALARAGHRVEVFVPRKDPRLADLALRREEHGGYAVNWITNNQDPASPREALLVPELRNAFAAFLERERPEVVHFQHLIKLGLGLVEAARERGLPTLYTAHDYYPVCHRYTLLRPDLSRCDVRGDSAACARCDLALGHLNAQPDLGDYHAGVLPSQLTGEAWNGLQAILAGVGASEEAQRAATEQRAELDRLRAEAYRAFDLVLAPSRFLIEELVRGGLQRERIELAPYGFDCADLAGLPPVRRDPGRAVRFAFLGGLAKHKGVHVLLDAFGELAGRAELAVWGGSSDKRYVELVRRRCGEVGAQWRGPYERAELREILAGVDALVVPSIWVENYPLVIHEGFAAGRPVLASNLGALPESVQDGVNGLLFAPGDAADLTRALERCIDEPELLPRLARGIRPGRTMEQEARDMAARYEALRARAGAARSGAPLPPSLLGTLARYDELSALPSRDLFVRVLSGLDDLREGWAGEMGAAGAVDLLALGLGEGSEAQDRLREARNEIAWLRTKKEELDEGREELMTLFEDLDRLLNETRAGSQRTAEHLESAGLYVRRKEAEVSEAHARLRELEAVIAEKDRYIGQVEGHLQEAGRYIRHKDQEYRDAENELRKAAEHVRTKEEELRKLREAQQAALEAHEAALREAHRAELEEALEEAHRATLEKAQATARDEREAALAEAQATARDEREAALAEAQASARDEREAALAEAQASARDEREAALAEARAKALAEREAALVEAREAAHRKERALEMNSRTVAQVGMLAIQAQERALNRAVRPILEILHGLLDPRGELLLPNENAPFVELLECLRAARTGLEALEKELRWRRPMKDELDWRRARMTALLERIDNSPALRFALGLTPARHGLRTWRAGPPPPAEERQP